MNFGPPSSELFSPLVLTGSICMEASMLSPYRLPRIGDEELSGLKNVFPLHIEMKLIFFLYKILRIHPDPILQTRAAGTGRR